MIYKILFIIAISLYGHNFCSDLIDAAQEGDLESVKALLLNPDTNINEKNFTRDIIGQLSDGLQIMAIRQ